MKNSRIFSTILAVLLLPSIALAQGYTVPGSELARPRSLVDHGRTDRLTGTPNPISTPGYCPSGQVFSGGACVLISNQGVLSGTPCGYADIATRAGLNGFSFDSWWNPTQCNGVPIAGGRAYIHSGPGFSQTFYLDTICPTGYSIKSTSTSITCVKD